MTKVEEVARAIAQTMLDDNDGTYDWFVLTESVADEYYAAARAAIEAMRVPTLDMKMTSQHVFMNPNKNYTFQGSDWDRVIDVALSPSPASTDHKHSAPASAHSAVTD